MKSSTHEIINHLQLKIGSEDFKDNHRVQANFFTRSRFLNFTTVMMSLINKLNKSLSVEVTKFLQRFGKGIVSKQAFSKARYKISHKAFIELNETLLNGYYTKGDYQLFRKKYLLLAADGSDYQLPWEKDIVHHFGIHDNGQGGQRCLGKAVNIWDVVNQMNLSSFIWRITKRRKGLFSKSLAAGFGSSKRCRVKRTKTSFTRCLLSTICPVFKPFTTKYGLYHVR